MVCAIGTPRRHPESGIYWFRKRVPERLRARVGRREIKFSLGTRDPAIARLKNLEAILEVERAWAGHDVTSASAEALQSHFKVDARDRLPITTRPQTTAPAPAERTLPGLRVAFEVYAAEAELAAATYKRWAPVISIFVVFLGHDEPARISRADVTGWKDSLLGEGRSTRTVRDVYLASVRATLQYAVDQGHIAENPADRVKVRVRKALNDRDKGFDSKEAATILAATLQLASDRTSSEMAAARRWVPWICAYTGARVNEITCLSGRDIVDRNGIKMIRVRAETNKTRNARHVPLHPHIVEQGFLDYARSRGAKPLFYEPSRSRGGKDGNPHFKKVGERLAEWVRALGIDARVAPNHGWRHRFSSVARYIGMPEDVRNVIQGHAAAKVADRYGDTWPEVAAREIAKIPAYRVLRFEKVTFRTGRETATRAFARSGFF